MTDKNDISPVVGGFKKYETLIENLKELSQMGEWEFQNRKNAYYARTVMNDAALAIPELEAYKNNLNLYMVTFSKHEGQQWTCHSGGMFARNSEDVEQLLAIKYGTEINVRSVEMVDITEGMILFGHAWRNE